MQGGHEVQQAITRIAKTPSLKGDAQHGAFGKEDTCRGEGPPRQYTQGRQLSQSPARPRAFPRHGGGASPPLRGGARGQDPDRGGLRHRAGRDDGLRFRLPRRLCEEEQIQKYLRRRLFGRGRVLYARQHQHRHSLEGVPARGRARADS